MAHFPVSELPSRLAGNVLKHRLAVDEVLIPKVVCDTMFGRANLKVGVQRAIQIPHALALHIDRACWICPQ